MKTIQELQEELNHVVRSSQDIASAAEKRGTILTKEENDLIDAHLKTRDDLLAEIEHVKAMEARLNRVNEAVKALGAKNPAKTSPENPTTEPAGGQRDTIEIPSYSARYGSLKAFRGKNAEFGAFKAGQMLRAYFHGDYRAARWCETNGINLRAMSEGSNTAGGFLVPNEMSQAIIDLREQYGAFRRLTRVRPMAGDTMLIPRRTGGVTASFVNEATAPTASDKSFDQVQLTAKKLAALTYVSEELAEDAIINLADDLAQEFAYAFALKEDQCGFTGTGTSTYGGINGINNKILGLAGAVNAASGHDTFAEIDAVDLTTCMGKLPAYARMNAKWICSQTCFDVVFSRLMAAGGGNTIQTLGGPIQRSYLGYPIEISQVMPTSTGSLVNAVMLLFGDMSMATSLGERRGIQVKRSDEIKFVEGQIALKATERVDIVVHDIGDANTAGAVVALIGA